MNKLLYGFALVTSLAFGACTSDGAGVDTAATCPTANAPTYPTFGKTFMTKYCTACHSAMAENRFDAPANLNFDTEADVRAHATAIDHVAGAGPKGQNSQMPVLDEPPVKIAPSDVERQQLAQMLACMKTP